MDEQDGTLLDWLERECPRISRFGGMVRLSSSNGDRLLGDWQPTLRAALRAAMHEEGMDLGAYIQEGGERSIASTQQP